MSYFLLCVKKRYLGESRICHRTNHWKYFMFYKPSFKWNTIFKSKVRVMHPNAGDLDGQSARGTPPVRACWPPVEGRRHCVVHLPLPSPQRRLMTVRWASEEDLSPTHGKLKVPWAQITSYYEGGGRTGWCVNSHMKMERSARGV